MNKRGRETGERRVDSEEWMGKSSVRASLDMQREWRYCHREGGGSETVDSSPSLDDFHTLYQATSYRLDAHSAHLGVPSRGQICSILHFLSFDHSPR